eukprot:750939-Hanusia_phi.AAC.5
MKAKCEYTICGVCKESNELFYCRRGTVPEEFSMNDPKEPSESVQPRKRACEWHSSDSDWENRGSKNQRSDSPAMHNREINRELSKIYIDSTIQKHPPVCAKEQTEDHFHPVAAHSRTGPRDMTPRQLTDSDDDGSVARVQIPLKACPVTNISTWMPLEHTRGDSQLFVQVRRKTSKQVSNQCVDHARRHRLAGVGLWCHAAKESLHQGHQRDKDCYAQVINLNLGEVTANFLMEAIHSVLDLAQDLELREFNPQASHRSPSWRATGG